MKKLSAILASILLGVCSIFASGCILTQAQTMKNIQGTYKMTYYTVTDKHYNAEGAEETDIIDQVEKYGYEFYFVVTGNSTGYFAYKSATEGPYVREVELKYEQGSEEDTGKYSYVCYKDYSETEYERMGVTKNHLKEAKLAVCWKPFGVPVTSPGFDRSWEKVDKATNLSYVKKQWGEVPTYTYEGWAREGGYQVSRYYNATDIPEGQEFVDPYLYYYFVLDTYKMKATTYYASSADKAPKTKEENITLVNGWSEIKIGEEAWTLSGTSYSRALEVTETNFVHTMYASKWYTRNAAEEIQLEIDRILNPTGGDVNAGA